MRSGGVPWEDFDMENSILTVPGVNFWFWSGKNRNYEIYKNYEIIEFRPYLPKWDGGVQTAKTTGWTSATCC